MAYRVHITIEDSDGNTVFREQVLGNNECFFPSQLTQLGVEHDEEMYIEKAEIELAEFIKVFTEHYTYRFREDFKENDWAAAIADLKEPSTFVHKVPSFSTIGHYLITLHKLLYEATYDKQTGRELTNFKAYLSAG